MPDADFYIMQFEPEIQRRLMTIRFAAQKVFPEAEEKIWHGVISLMINNKDVCNYGAYKDHITMWLGYDSSGSNLVELVKKRYPKYRYTKVTIQFSHDEPFPDELIREICELLRKKFYVG